MTKYISWKVLIVLIITLFLVAPAVNAVPVTVNNFSFESSAGTFISNRASGSYTTGGFTGWTHTGSGSWGIWAPTTSHYSQAVPNGNYVGFLQNGSVFQDTGWVVQANNIFTLSVDIGNRLDLAFGSYSVELWAGSNLLASGNSVVPGGGQFSTLTLPTYTALAGDPNIGATLGIRITAGGQQLNFDNIRLSNDPYLNGGQSAAPVPEPGTMVLLGMGLAGIAGVGRSRLKKK